MLSGEIIVGRRSWPSYDKARIEDYAGCAWASIDAHHVPAFSDRPGRRE